MSLPYRDTLEPRRERARSLTRRRDLLRGEALRAERRLARVKESLMTVMIPETEGGGWRWAALAAGTFVGALLALCA
jgi:hypothetical protein